MANLKAALADQLTELIEMGDGLSPQLKRDRDLLMAIRRALEKMLELAADDGLILPGRRFTVHDLVPTGDLAE